MQRIFNYGSFLQAYALKKLIEDFNCKVEFVDYHLGNSLIPVKTGKGFVRKCLKVIEVLKCHAPLKEKLHFIQYKKNYANNYYPLLGIGKEMNYTPKLDLLIIGSDEVFNCVQDNANVGFSPELFGVNNRANRLISYAASFGNTTLEKLKKYEIEKQIAKWLLKFDALSVRDTNSKKIVEKLTNRKVICNYDPVLMYDFMNRCKEIPKEIPESDYMILYGYSGRFTHSECKLIREYAKQKKIKIICIGGIQHCCDKFIMCDPFEVIAYFQHAQCVVTDTFHGTILSIITHRKFATFVRENGYGNAEKLNDLLNHLELQDQMVNELGDLKKVIEKVINYEKIDKLIAEGRKNTEKYLSEQIVEI